MDNYASTAVVDVTGQTALDIVTDLLKWMEGGSSLGEHHKRITRGGSYAIAEFRTALERIKGLLSK